MSSPAVTFGSLGVPSALVDALSRQGILEPFEVQAATIPDALAGRDVLARAPTGSGKTLAFGLPLIAQLGSGESRRPRGLILSPTRELAEQIRRELEPLAKAANRSVIAVYGGVGFGPQVTKLKRGVDLMVACPGRLQDLIDQGHVSLDRVDQVVVDEADRMADMGFLPAVRALLDMTSTNRQTVLFSATLDNDVKILRDQYQNDPARHEIGEAEPDLSLVTHRFIATEKEQKLGLSADLIDDAGPTMVFCRTRHGVDRVARQLKRAGVKAGWIHGGRTQSQRDTALGAFTAGKVNALVATDVAARGIHVDGVACVIHFDPPADHKDYVHRSGRTARAGAGGVVVSLVNRDQRKAVARLRKQVGLPGGEPEPTPEVRERQAQPWVDQRPERSPSSKRPKRRSPSRGDRDDRPSNRRPDRSDSQRGDSRPNGERRDRTDSRRGDSRPSGEQRDRTETNRSESRRSYAKPSGERRERGETNRTEAKTEGPRGNVKPRGPKPTDAKRNGRKPAAVEWTEGSRGNAKPRGPKPADAKRGGKRPEGGRDDRDERKRTEGKRPEGKRTESKRPEGKRTEGKRPEGKRESKASKRSGRARAKNHKQARNKASATRSSN